MLVLGCLKNSLLRNLDRSWVRSGLCTTVTTRCESECAESGNKNNEFGDCSHEFNQLGRENANHLPFQVTRRIRNSLPLASGLSLVF